MIMVVGSMNLSGPLSGAILDARWPPTWDLEKNETVLGVFGRGSNPQYRFDLHTFVAFDNLQVEFVGGQEAVPVLNEMANRTEAIVLAIEAETRRLGLIP